MTRNFSVVFFAALVFLMAGCAWSAVFTAELSKGWKIQSSEKVSAEPASVSRTGFDAGSWYPAEVPTTVLAALVENGVYENPYYGLNMKSIPGFVEGRMLAMPKDSPFYPPWWHRTEFSVPAGWNGKKIVLHLDGINYQAEVWLNGRKIAGADEVISMFRRFDFDVSEYVRPGANNCLALLVSAPGKIPDIKYATKQVQATTGWDDHNPYPPDLNAGLWRKVYFTAYGPARIKHPYVRTDLDTPSLKTARLTVSAYVQNLTDEKLKAELTGRIEDMKFSKEIELAARQEKRVEFSPSEFNQLTIDDPRVWWPNPLGPQELYQLDLELKAGAELSDRTGAAFGIRKAETFINDEGWRVYKINGRRVLIRGGAWMTTDMFLNLTERRYDALIRYAREANLNMLRSEGFSIRETDEFYDLCDRYGVMVTQQIFGRSIPREELAIACARDMMLRIRNHPSLVHFLGHDETYPTQTLDKAYRDMIEEYEMDRTYQPHSGAFRVKNRRDTGGTRTGTLELWTHAGPAHYYTHKQDGAWGFAQSGGIGGILAEEESLRRMMPGEALWPLWSEAFSFHTNLQGGHYYDFLLKALEKRYGEPETFEEFVRKTHAMNYESARGMYEAYARNKYSATGITTWKYDVAWPAALTWQYIDYYLLPTAAYYGAKKACEPLHVQYSYDDHSVYVVNSFYRAFEGLQAGARIYNMDMSVKYEKRAEVDVGEDGKTEAFVIEWPEGLSTAHFLYLTLHDQKGDMITDNLYWLSTRPDRPGKKFMGMVKITPYSYPDFTGLEELPQVGLSTGCEVKRAGDELEARVHLENDSGHIAFLTQIAVTKGPGGMEVAPSFWDENYISLLPGHEKDVSARFYPRDQGGSKPVIRVRGWNVEETVCTP